MHSSSPFRAAAIAILLAVSAFVSSPLAAQTADRRPTPQPEVSVPAGPVMAMDAEGTREALMQLLSKHPPAVGRVFKLDPSLMRNEGYLATYPALRQFLAEHPEIQQNAGYYLAPVRGVNDSWDAPRSPRLEMLESTLAGAVAFAVFVIVLGALIWLTRTVLEQRRWNRLSKIQAEVHSKLMDRFSSNDELIAYVQTPSGRRFLESGPSPLQETMTPSIGAPLSRILWSVQAGSVLTIAGLGILLTRNNILDEDFRVVVTTFGMLILALGVGFVVSAVAAYALSHKLGLLTRTPAQDHA